MRKQLTLAVILLVAMGCGDIRLPTEPSVQTTPTVPAGTASSPGRYEVGTAIEPGRYFSAPALSNCRYQLDRTGGFSRTLVGSFVPRQWIVDILPSDKVFRTESDCGTWFKDSPRQGEQTSISPGMWLVGSQIAPGTYATVARGECGFNRLRNFHSLDAESVIEFGYAFNEPASVTISAEDVGFSTTSECGIWTREGAPQVQRTSGSE